MGDITESKTITSLKSQLLAIRALVDEALASCEGETDTPTTPDAEECYELTTRNSWWIEI
jgi:hypothetical protein